MDDLQHIKSVVAKLYSRYKTCQVVYHTISILLNIFTIIVCPIIILLEYFQTAHIIIASSVVGFINNMIFNLSGLSQTFDKKANQCLKLEKIILNNKKPTPRFIAICNLELKTIREPCIKWKRRPKKPTSIRNTSNTPEEVYQIERYCLFETENNI